ncbi:MAG: hypothetical protein ACRD7E_16480, partial [Bryobacteraceae bacterium]
HRTVESLTQALTEIKSASVGQVASMPVLNLEQRSKEDDSEFVQRILLPDLGGDERDETLTGRP